ncbi:MAG: sigma 54-interacting transcriptional regulator [Ignavibacteria bacterium]|jgi:Nif-specific regulatory protein|nr:sigma 54-interacting transcriptional regulator [Ignavibacteria bacterium]MDH7527016.1 sigma 54-interacting transcriptional regulator [Ignavibacteria bacterium]NPV10839.1 sigma 54-interacting transcriptional regulator [Ignavibacteria bacterium]
MALVEEIKKIKSITREQFELLYNISRKLNSLEYEEGLIDETLDLVINVVNAERGLFAKYDTAKNDFEIIAARNVKKESIQDLSSFSSGILQKVVQNKKPFLYHDVQSDPSLSQFDSVQIHRIKSVLGVPIIKDGNVWGVILVDSQINRKEFTEENLIFLDFFSNLVSLALDKILNLQKLEKENLYLKNQLQSTQKIPEIVGDSPAIKKLFQLIHKVASTDATVLILGESGTGKELVARSIHNLSQRKDKPYIAQFCGSIPDTLLESELFGYKKGAFTGATSDKKGLFEVADGGTFFLDEIADISPALQAKLLRVLQNKEITRLGDTKPIKVDVRIIAATNKDLKQLVNENKFREDLFYRLNVFPIEIPPLRERRSDIPLLAHHFIKKYSNREITITPQAMKKLENFYWPGNVRQLENVIQRALILCDSNQLTPEHIIIEDEENLLDFKGTLEDFEKLLLLKRLKEYDGNRTQTAKSLGVSVRWVQMKLKEINSNEFREDE